MAAPRFGGCVGERGWQQSIALGGYSLVWPEQRGRSHDGDLMVVTPRSSGRMDKGWSVDNHGSRHSLILFWMERKGRRKSPEGFKREKKMKNQKCFGGFLFFDALYCSWLFFWMQLCMVLNVKIYEG